MALFGLPAALRLQIWHRHLALRGRLSKCPGNASPVSSHPDYDQASSRRNYATSEPHTDYADLTPMPGVSIAEAMGPNKTRHVLLENQSRIQPAQMVESGHCQKGDIPAPASSDLQPDGGTGRKRLFFGEQKEQQFESSRKHPPVSKRQEQRNGFAQLLSIRKHYPPSVIQAKSSILSRNGAVRHLSAGTHFKSESPLKGADPDAGPSNAQDLQTHLEVPTQTQYPHADPNLFVPHLAERAIRRACRNHLGHDVGSRTVYQSEIRPGVCVWEKVLEIPSLVTVSAVGEASTAADASSAASIQLLAKLHAEGILHKLAPAPPNSDEGERFDVIMSSFKDDYHPIAPALFEPTKIAMTMNNAFMKAGIPYKVEGHTEVKESNRMVAYDLTVELSDELRLTAVDEARNKHLAKSLAWAHMLSKLQNTGTLQRLFPTISIREGQPPVAPTKELDDDLDEEVANLEDLVAVDKKTMRDEKDAKQEIYNWAASLGMVPVFHIRVVRKRKPGTRTKAKANFLKLVEASVELPELNLKTIRVAKTLSTAETAAAIAFKSAAEEKEKAGLIQAPLKADPLRSLLNVETTGRFFDFYRSVKEKVYLEVENEPFRVAGETLNAAQITINEQRVGRAVVMVKKPVAEQIARLTAAVDIVNAEPQLLEQFAAVVRKDRGKVLREVRAIKTLVDGHTVDLMRNGVVEARRAGLSDIRQSLLAVNTTSEDPSVRRRHLPTYNYRKAISKGLLTISRKRKSDGIESTSNAPALLPMSQYCTHVLDLVKRNSYSIIVGATGSGKTTQVPQIILDDAVDRGEGGFCDVVCTQPRRLAAISVASRVAAERQETVGEKVGYHVRFDAKLPTQGGSITYCTTGILLEQLKHDAEGVFDCVSHIVIDEVHERSLPIDFLMVLLKRTMKERHAAGKSVPKVILMSATLDPDLFAKYFASEELDSPTPAPVLKVPGRTFPVQEKYVEDILADFSTSEAAALDAMANLDKGVTSDYLENELSFARSAQRAAAPVIDWKNEFKVDESEEDQAAAREKNDARVPLTLMAAAVAHICRKNDEGAILAFLPGLSEILTVRNFLYQNTPLGLAFDDPDKFKILALHSALPPNEQNDVLEPVPKGCRKIILSTNIAETSVTVPDVKYVVDSGKLRQKRYDQVRRITQLVTTWESSSNARQRAGRAGRVQAGNYYALFSRKRRQAMPASAPPELHLSDLQEICLSVKAQGFDDSVQSFLSEAIEPPSDSAVLGAIDDLKAIEALTQDESLTALGKTLSNLPVHPSLSKMILLGIVFRCLDPMVSLSSMDRDRSLFVNPPGKRAEAKAILKKYNHDGSDQLAVYEAFKELRSIRDHAGLRAAEQHGRANFLHVGCFKSAVATAESIEKILVESRLVPESSIISRGQFHYGGAALNRHSNNPALIKALFLAGVHPNLAAKNAKWKTYRSPSEQGNMIHPTSLNHVNPNKSALEGDKLLAYESLRKTIDGTRMFVKDITEVTPLHALLFGGHLKAASTRVTMDDWLPFKIENLHDSTFATKLVLEFRKALDRMLNGAFNSLSELQEGVTIADDPIREGFVKATVAVLEHSSQRKENEKKDSGIVVPPEWKKGSGKYHTAEQS